MPLSINFSDNGIGTCARLQIDWKFSDLSECFLVLSYISCSLSWAPAYDLNLWRDRPTANLVLRAWLRNIPVRSRQCRKTISNFNCPQTSSVKGNRAQLYLQQTMLLGHQDRHGMVKEISIGNTGIPRSNIHHLGFMTWDISNYSESHSVAFAEIQLNVVTMSHLFTDAPVPTIDLQTELRNKNQLQLQRGPVCVMLEQTFVALASLPMCQPGDTFILNSPDPGFRITRESKNERHVTIVRNIRHFAKNAAVLSIPGFLASTGYHDSTPFTYWRMNKANNTFVEVSCLAERAILKANEEVELIH